MKIDIVIPNYNGSHLLAKSLPDIVLSHQNYNGKIIIVDDGSDKNDIERLENFLRELSNDKIMLYKHDKNKGFSSTVNTGVSQSTADIIVLLNTDVIPGLDFLKSPIKKFTESQDLFAVGCMDESIEGDSVVRRGRGIGYWKNGMLYHKRGEVDKNDTFWVSGGSSLYDRKLFTKLLGMDEIYNPFYWEDIDLSYRAQKAGYKILFDRDSKVVHYHEKGAIKKNYSSNRVNEIAYRNQFIFIWKNITSKSLILSHIFFLPFHVTRAIIRVDKAFLTGLFLALLKLPAIIDRRNKQKKFYKVSDLEIIKSFS